MLEIFDTRKSWKKEYGSQATIFLTDFLGVFERMSHNTYVQT